MREGTAGSPEPPLAVVDAHVHLHECHDVSRLLDAAYANLQEAVGRVDSGAWTGVLCLTECAGVDAFSRVRDDRDALGDWSPEPTEEEISLWVRREGGKALLIVSGFQVRTREGLEVLALGTRTRPSDGESLEASILAAELAGALPVVPWGFGKWSGSRRKTVERVVRNPPTRPLFVGDNANRIRSIPRSRLFDVARSSGVFALPGSDPFPFPEQETSVGRAGVVLEMRFGRRHPGRDLVGILSALDSAPRSFMKFSHGMDFVRSQVKMQVKGLGRRLQSRTEAG